jgi:hypothetical protein
VKVAVDCGRGELSIEGMGVHLGPRPLVPSTVEGAHSLFLEDHGGQAEGRNDAADTNRPHDPGAQS